MNLPDIATALSLGKSALDIMKQVKDLLPEGANKEEAVAKLEQAEKDLRLAQAKVAKDLGYKLCYCSIPPEVMLQNKDGLWVCQSCSRELNPFGIG